jgi:ABC-type multidrug transport system ATPase subunit
LARAHARALNGGGSFYNQSSIFHALGDPIEHALNPPLLPVPVVLQADGLRFSYPQQALFDSVQLQAPAGVTLVRGGDGAGKTTLMRLLAGELAAQSGELEICNVRLKDQPSAYRQQVFWVEPRSASFDAISPTDYFVSLRTAYPKFDYTSIAALAEGLSLTEHLHKPMYMLSTGSKRKVWLAAAFASGAALALLDDPFAALDKPSISYVKLLLKHAAAQTARALVVTSYDATALGDVPLAARIDLGG